MSSPHDAFAMLQCLDNQEAEAMASAQIFLRGASVTRDFREALFDAANRAGVTPNEFVIVAAAEKLARSGASFPGVFRAKDFEMIGMDAPAIASDAGKAA